MDFLIQTAWYSIKLHGHAMAFHGTASVLQGTPWHSMELYNIPWNSMDLQGNSMKFHGIPWNSITTLWILRGTPWHSMKLHGYSMELHGIPWNSMDTPWILHGSSVQFHGFPWNSMDFHRFPWISMEFHGGISHGEGGMMIANDGPFCPVSSFEKYLSVLNPMNEYLFQRPKKSAGEGEIWYDNMVVIPEHSRQEDESHLTPGGVVNNIHKSFNQSDDHNYTRQKWI